MNLNPDPKRNRKITLTLLAACVLSVSAALLVGIDDNPPGILLLYVASFALVLAMVHHWRSMKRFLLLAGMAAIGFIVFAVLHNVMHGVAKMATDVFLVESLLEGIGVLSFFLALFLCPPAVLTGLGGALFWSVRNRTRNDA
jgi:hypothetical protein